MSLSEAEVLAVAKAERIWRGKSSGKATAYLFSQGEQLFSSLEHL